MKNWIAHRGNNNHPYLENTKEALLSALNTDYIIGVELDVRKTLDNHLVLIHNPMISWNSDGVGIVKYMNLEELKQYNFGTKENPSKICTLHEFLKSVHSSKIILIDVKVNGIDDLLYQTILSYNYLNLYICSFDYDFVIHFKKKYPTYKVGLIMGKLINHNKDLKSLDFIVTKDPKVPFSKEIFIWDVESKKQLHNINSSYNIITDKSYLLKD